MLYSVIKLSGCTLCHRGSIDVNSDTGKNQAEALLNELIEKIDSTHSSLKAQKSYDLEKSLDFQCAKDEFQVRICNFLITVLHVYRTLK